MTFELEDILSLLPHRPPMLFLDRVVDVRPATSGTGLKAAAWSGAPAAPGPAGQAGFPWVFTLEMLAQTAGVVCAAARAGQGSGQPAGQEGAFGYLASIDAGLSRPVRPLDPLEAQVSITRIWGGLIMFEGTLKAGGRPAVQARMSISAGDAKA